MQSLEFWFEFGSTYSYLAAMRVEQVAAAAGLPLIWKPFLLGPLFARQGWHDSPFNINPVRGRYMWRDMERWCERYGLPFRKPTSFPRNGVLAARVALLGADQPWGPGFVRAVYQANFAADEDIADSSLIGSILDELGQPGSDLVAEALAPANKARLREQTDAAWNAGIFGAPSLLVDGELFWGNDRLEEAVAWALRGS